MREVLLIFESVRLRESSAIRVSEQCRLAKPQCSAHSLHVLDHVLNRVAGRIFQLLRTPGAALVDENQLVVASQGKQVRKKIIVRGSRTTVNDEQRLRSAADSVIDRYTARINKAFRRNGY